MGAGKSKIAAGYIRVSSQSQVQDGTSLDSQREDIFSAIH